MGQVAAEPRERLLYGGRRPRRPALGLVVLLWIAAPSAAVAAPGDPGDRRLTIAAGVDHLVLGEQRQATLRIAGPPSVSRIAVTASLGDVSDLERVAPGRWKATYHCPAAFYPQVAILAAVSDGRAGEPSAVGWKVLPLWGRGEAKVKTQRNAEVTVRIGEQTFGPVRADRRGRARVKVVVPPGVDHGVDGRGRRVDLELPPIPRLHAVAWPTRVVGVKAGRSRLLMLTVAPDGASRDDGSAPKVTGLSASAPERIGQGLWLSRLEVPAGKPSELAVRATLDDRISAAEVTIVRTAGPPAKVVVRAPPRTEDDAPTLVQLRVLDALGTPVDPAQPPLASAPAGRFGPVSQQGPGQYAVSWIPPRWSSRKRVTLDVRADDAVGQATVELGYPANAWRRRLRPYWFWTAVGVSSAVLISAVITRGIALSKSSEYKDPATTIERRYELKDVGEPLTTYSSVALGVGAAAVVGTAVIYYFTDFDHEQPSPTAPSSDRVSLSAGLGGASLTLRF